MFVSERSLSLIRLRV